MLKYLLDLFLFKWLFGFKLFWLDGKLLLFIYSFLFCVWFLDGDDNDDGDFGFKMIVLSVGCGCFSLMVLLFFFCFELICESFFVLYGFDDE